MAAVTVCSDFGVQEKKICYCFHFSPVYLPWSAMGPDAMIFIFWMLSFKPAFSLSSFTLIKRLFSSSLLSAVRVVSSAYMRLLILLPAILIPVCYSSSLAFLMMCSAYRCAQQTGWQQTVLSYSFLNLEPVSQRVLLLVDLNTGFWGDK